MNEILHCKMQENPQKDLRSVSWIQAIPRFFPLFTDSVVDGKLTWIPMLPLIPSDLIVADTCRYIVVDAYKPSRKCTIIYLMVIRFTLKCSVDISRKIGVHCPQLCMRFVCHHWNNRPFGGPRPGLHYRTRGACSVMLCPAARDTAKRH